MNSTLKTEQVSENIISLLKLKLSIGERYYEKYQLIQLNEIIERFLELEDICDQILHSLTHTTDEKTKDEHIAGRLSDEDKNVVRKMEVVDGVINENVALILIRLLEQTIELENKFSILTSKVKK